MIQMRSKFHWAGVCIINTRPDEINRCFLPPLLSEEGTTHQVFEDFYPKMAQVKPSI
jgi:hypothetical protein